MDSNFFVCLSFFLWSCVLVQRRRVLPIASHTQTQTHTHMHNISLYLSASLALFACLSLSICLSLPLPLPLDSQFELVPLNGLADAPPAGKYPERGSSSGKPICPLNNGQCFNPGEDAMGTVVVRPLS